MEQYSGITIPTFRGKSHRYKDLAKTKGEELNCIKLTIRKNNVFLASETQRVTNCEVFFNIYGH